MPRMTESRVLMPVCRAARQQRLVTRCFRGLVAHFRTMQRMGQLIKVSPGTPHFGQSPRLAAHWRARGTLRRSGRHLWLAMPIAPGERCSPAGTRCIATRCDRIRLEDLALRPLACATDPAPFGCLIAVGYCAAVAVNAETDAVLWSLEGNLIAPVA